MKANKKTACPAVSLQPGVIPQLSERLRSLEQLQYVPGDRIEYAFWGGKDVYFGLKFCDVVKIDYHGPIRSGDFVNVRLPGSPIETFAIVGARTDRTHVELSFGLKPWLFRRSHCSLARVLGRLTLEASQRLFLSKRWRCTTEEAREGLGDLIEKLGENLDRDTTVEPPVEGPIVSLIQRTGRLLYFKPR